jgi:hypothetical protein
MVAPRPTPPTPRLLRKCVLVLMSPKGRKQFSLRSNITGVYTYWGYRYFFVRHVHHILFRQFLSIESPRSSAGVNFSVHGSPY